MGRLKARTSLPRPLAGTIQDGGVYDYQTQTLRPPGSVSHSGPDAAYDNSATPRYYVDAVQAGAAPGGSTWFIDSGAIPGPANTGTFPSSPTLTDILVDGFEFAYCDENAEESNTFFFVFSSGLGSPGGLESNWNAYFELADLPSGGCYRVRVDLGVCRA